MDKPKTAYVCELLSTVLANLYINFKVFVLFKLPTSKKNSHLKKFLPSIQVFQLSRLFYFLHVFYPKEMGLSS